VTIKSDRVISDINRLIDTFREQGKMPNKVFITKQQYADLRQGLGKSEEKNWKPRIRTIPIEEIT
jgi:hypothetical protein